MSQKVTRRKKAVVTVTASNSAGFGAGYISYTKKTFRQQSTKIHVVTIYIYKYINYYYLLIFNVTNVTPLSTRANSGLSGLRYNVTT